MDMVARGAIGRMCGKNLDVIGLVGFKVRKVCDNSRARSCEENIKGVTIIVSWKVDVLCAMENFMDAREFVRSC